VSRFLAAHQHN